VHLYQCCTWLIKDIKEQIPETGWTSFGDDHLFIPEAAYHRKILLTVAKQSVLEVLIAATSSAGGGDADSCQMCRANIFPIPTESGYISSETNRLIHDGQTNLLDRNYRVGSLVQFESTPIFEQRSRDPRIPGVPVEGWKIGIGLVGYYDRSDNKGEAGVALGLDYMRSTDPRWPNTLGLELWNVPNLYTSVLLTTGYIFPREVSPVSFAFKAKLGFRTDENFTSVNPTASRRNRAEIAIPVIEAVYEIYPPLSLFLQYSPFTVLFRSNDNTTEGPNIIRLQLGIRLDLSGI
jgi:hypothetical protein